MNRFASISLFCLAAAPAQAFPQSLPTPGEPPGAPSRLAPDEPVFDEGADGSVIAAGADFVARFDASGAQFVPFFGADAERTWPIAFSLASARVGATALELSSSAPQRAGNLLSFARGAAIERYVLQRVGMEQQFLFETLPARGELVMTIDVATDLAGADGGKGRGIRFESPRGAVQYGAAVAIDAAGSRTALEMALVGGDIELRVPASFVEDCSLPLLVDPLVTTVQTFNTHANAIGDMDFAFDAQLGEWLAVWEYAAGGGDYHVYAQRIGQGGNNIGSVIVIDASSASWRKPRVANHAVSHKFLVVAEVDDASPETWVAGRIVTIANNSVSLGAAFPVAKSNVGNMPIGYYSAPDVGGDGDTNTTGRFAVAVEYGLPPDRDIHVRMISDTGTQVYPYPILLATSSYDERRPRLSKTNGFGNHATQTWGLVYERRTTLGNNTGDNTRLWMSLLDTTGSPRSLLGQTTWTLDDNSVANRGGFDVSSPTDDLGGTRYLLAVQSKSTATEGRNLFGHLFTHQGLGGAIQDLTQLEGLSASTRAKDQYAPAVDCDGVRFAVAYQLDYSATDRDVKATTFARLPGGQLVVHEAGADIAVGTGNEDGPALCSRRSGNGIPGRYLAGYHTISNGMHQLRCSVYEGLAVGGVAWRATACGGLAMTVQNEPGVGMPVWFHLTGVTGIGAFLVGAPLNVAIPGCLSCTLGTTGDAVVYASDWTPVIPNQIGLVGITFAVQGFEISASGPCLGQVKASNTADVTIR